MWRHTVEHRRHLNRDARRLWLESFQAAGLESLPFHKRKSRFPPQRGTELPLSQRFSMTEWTAWFSVNWPSEGYLVDSGR